MSAGHVHESILSDFRKDKYFAARLDKPDQLEFARNSGRYAQANVASFRSLALTSTRQSRATDLPVGQISFTLPAIVAATARELLPNTRQIDTHLEHIFRDCKVSSYARMIVASREKA